MQQAGYNKRGERCPKAEEAKAFIAQRKEQCDRREQCDYAASRVQKKSRALPKGRGSEGVYCAAQGAMRPVGSSATMQQAGYDKRGERCPKAEEAKAFIAQRKEQCDRREQCDYAASRVQKKSRARCF